MDFITARAWLTIRLLVLTSIVLLSTFISGCTSAQTEQAPALQTAEAAPLATTESQPKASAGSAAATYTPHASLPSKTLAAPLVPVNGPLSVVIESPADNTIVFSSPITITGQADPETVITFNDTFVLVSQDRLFSVEVALVEGINLIEIIASDVDENQEVYYLTIDFEPQP